MLDDEMQKRVDEAKQRAWDEMSPEERNYQHAINDRSSPAVENEEIKRQKESDKNGFLIIAGCILFVLISLIFF